MSVAGDEWFPDHVSVLDEDLAAFVREEDRERSLTVVREIGDPDIDGRAKRWVAKLRKDNADVDACSAMQIIVDRHADGSREEQRAGIVAAIRFDERGHVGLAAALDALFGVRSKDPRDFWRMVESARRVVLSEPTPAGEKGCSCPGGFEKIERPERVSTGSDQEEREADDYPSTARTDDDADLDVALAGYFDGDIEPEPTSRGVRRNDGVPLLYARKTHAAVGETEAGKSWLALACTAAELTAGRRVLYVHFEESDPSSTVLRLRQMGVPREHLLSGRFRFAGVERRLTRDRVAKLAAHRADVAILDGVNAAMAMQGLNPNDAGEYGQFDALTSRTLAAHGAAVLALDHVVKNADQARTGYAGGTVMKLNMISGASFLLENREPLRPGGCGSTSVYVAKDRPGSLRAVAVSRGGRRDLLGTMWVDSTTALTEVRLTAPSLAAIDEENDDRPVDAKALKVLEAVVGLNDEKGREKPPSTTEMRKAKCGVGGGVVLGYLHTLESHGLIARETGDGGTRWVPLNPAAARALLKPGQVLAEDL